ncbi:MAG: M20 family metallopeptidase [Firmicutes bacterium]|nr:M20 family metallopeptidase [Bacillota bacterium]
MKTTEILKELITIKFWDGLSNRELLDYFHKAFKGCDIHEITETRTGNPYMVIGINCKLKNQKDAIILHGHMDTIVPPKEWDISPRVIDGKLHGLGSVDMRGFFAGIISALPELKKMKTPIILTISSDEETAIYGTDKIIEFLKSRRITPQLVIIGEPRMAPEYVAPYHNGCSVQKFVVKGKGAQMSVPQLGTNAIVYASKIVEFLNALKITTTVVEIGGGGSIATVPDTCEFKVLFSFPTQTEFNKEITKVKKYIKSLETGTQNLQISTEIMAHLPPLEENQSPKLMGVLEKMGVKLFDREVASKTVTEGGIYSNFCPDTIIFGPGDLKLCHVQDEHTPIEKLEAYPIKLVELLKEF